MFAPFCCRSTVGTKRLFQDGFAVVENGFVGATFGAYNPRLTAEAQDLPGFWTGGHLRIAQCRLLASKNARTDSGTSSSNST
jgi:hypothetical protein